MAKSHSHSYFFHWFLIYHFRISFAIISNVYSYSTLLSLFLILFTTIQYSMIWMFQGLFNQLLLTHWSHPFHAITNNTKHNCVHTSSSFLNVPCMKLLEWCRILDYHKVLRSPAWEVSSFSYYSSHYIQQYVAKDLTIPWTKQMYS